MTGSSARHSRGPLASFAAMLLLLILLAALPTALAGCSRRAPERPETESASAGESAEGVTYPALEGLVFVRGDQIWAVEDAVPQPVIESQAPRSVRAVRSREAITYVELDGPHALVQSAVRGDWRAEPLWESTLGSLLIEVVHDDVADALWFSAGGESTTTIGVRERGGDEGGYALSLPVDASGSFDVDFAHGTLYITGAAQHPTALHAIGETSRDLFSAALLFAPRLSPDGRTLVATGSERPGEPLRVWAIDVESGRGAVLEPGPGTPVDPVWSPDGSVIAFRDTETGTVWTVPARGGPSTDSGLAADEGGLAW